MGATDWWPITRLVFFRATHYQPWLNVILMDVLNYSIDQSIQRSGNGGRLEALFVGLRKVCQASQMDWYWMMVAAYELLSGAIMDPVQLDFVLGLLPTKLLDWVVA